MEVRDYHGYKVFEDTTIIGRTGSKLKSYRNSSSLVRVSMYYDGGYHCEYLHKVMAICFVPNPDNLPFVTHMDGDKDNNLPSNLMWTCTKSSSTKNSVGVRRIDKNGNVCEYRSLSDAGRKNNLSAANIHNFITGKQVDKRGYTWKKI